MSSDDLTLSPEVIQENPYPGQDVVTTQTTSDPGNKTTEEYGSTKLPTNPFPTPRIATELLSRKLNTRTGQILGSFTLTPSGALQIGNYQEGEYGDVRILPTGIVARNVLGDNTFLLDSATGDAYFAGTIQTGALISGVVLVGDGNIQINGEDRNMVFYAEDGLPSIVIGTVS